jgi:hypothetical protein
MRQIFWPQPFEDSRRFKDLHRKPANRHHAVNLKLPDDFFGGKSGI